MVGAAGFEPATTCSQSRCATRLRYTPVFLPHSTATTGILPCSGTCSASSLLLGSATLRQVTRPRNMRSSAFVVYDKPQSRCATRLRYTPVFLPHSKRRAFVAAADSPRCEVERPTRKRIGWRRILSGRRPACEHHLQTAGFALPNCGPSRSVRKSAHFSQPP